METKAISEDIGSKKSFSIEGAFQGLHPPTILSIIALLTGLGLIFAMLLGPVKKDIAKLELGQAKIEAKLDQLLAKP